MRKILPVVAALGLILLAVWVFRLLFPSDEKLIRALLNDLAKAASFEANESGLTRIANASKLGGFFTSDVVINLDATEWGAKTINGRDELIQMAAAARTTVPGLRLEFPDVNIEVAADGEFATAHVTAKANVPGQRDLYVHELKIALKKIEGDWRIIRADMVRTLTM